MTDTTPAEGTEGRPDLDAAFAAILAEVFEREAQHWDAEFSHLATHRGPRKVMAAWRLGASILRRRAEQYRSGTVTYLLPPTDEETSR